MLIETARECFYFVTKFFEPISASATHIYHSALELCPLLSAVRKLYYDRYNRIAHLPRVVVGAPYSWDPTISISGKDHDYGFCTWSPCGRFVAAQREKVVEIRSHLTFELVSILEPTETTLPLMGPLAYSPDGRSLACASNASIIIWDIQTGGIAKEIECHTKSISMALSLDGREIATIGSREAPSVVTYDTASGAILSVGELHPSDSLHLQAYGKTFRVTTIQNNPCTASIDIFEVRNPPVKVDSLSIAHGSRSAPSISFSPATYRLSVETGCLLRVLQNTISPAVTVALDIHRPVQKTTQRRTLSCLLKEEGHIFLHRCFSSDGTLFAASDGNCVRVWRCGDDDSYSALGKFRPQDCANSSLQFSPTLQSVLVHSRSILQVWGPHDLPDVSSVDGRQHHVALLRSGNHIVTAHASSGTVSIIGVHSQVPCRVIERNIRVDRLVVAGNVLLVVGSEEAVAWLLKEGECGGIVVSEREDGIWAVKLSRILSTPTLKIEGRVGVIEPDADTSLTFHTGTGEKLWPTQAPPFSGNPPNLLGRILCGRDYSHLHNLSQRNIPPKDVWQTSKTTLREGWVKDSEGRHRLWIPVEWREIWDPTDWCHDIKTQFSILRGEPIVVKF